MVQMHPARGALARARQERQLTARLSLARAVPDPSDGVNAPRAWSPRAGTPGAAAHSQVEPGQSRPGSLRWCKCTPRVEPSRGHARSGSSQPGRACQGRRGSSRWCKCTPRVGVLGSKPTSRSFPQESSRGRWPEDFCSDFERLTWCKHTPQVPPTWCRCTP